jgi:type IV fimbrial biogenesis protein FimT
MFNQLTRADTAAGFTLIEMLIGITIMSVLLALAIPAMGAWLLASKARSASEFYLDGFAMARRQAVAHNSASRITLSANTTNGQMDWQVDICFPRPGTPCDNLTGAWSTVAAQAGNDPEGAAGYTSVFRAATGLPPSEVLAPTIEPDGATAVYYTPLGWVDTNVQNRLTQLRFDPAARYAHDVPVAAVSLSLAGMPTKCDPTKAVGDSRACPP